MIQREENILIVQGEVNVNNVVALTQQGIELLRKGDHLQIDLQKVTEVDSTIISMLFEWLRAASKKNCHLSFSQLPENLQSLVQLYGVTNIIGPSTSSSPSKL